MVDLVSGAKSASDAGAPVDSWPTPQPIEVGEVIRLSGYRPMTLRVVALNRPQR